MARDRIDFDKFRFGEVKNDPDKSGFAEVICNDNLRYLAGGFQLSGIPR